VDSAAGGGQGRLEHRRAVRGRARKYYSDTSEPGGKREWTPGTTTFFGNNNVPIEGYPDKSAFMPHLEALLRLGDLDGANKVYDEFIKRWLPPVPDQPEEPEELKEMAAQMRSTQARMASEVAKSLGMDDVAKIWDPVQKSPDPTRDISASTQPYFYIFADWDSYFYKQFSYLFSQLSPGMRPLQDNRNSNDIGWKSDDGERWGLFAGDNRLLAQGSAVPDLDALRAIFKSNNVFGDGAETYFRSVLAEKGSVPGIELLLAYIIIRQKSVEPPGSQADQANQGRDSARWGEAARLLRRVLDTPDVLFNSSDYVYINSSATKNSPIMKSSPARTSPPLSP